MASTGANINNLICNQRNDSSALWCHGSVQPTAYRTLTTKTTRHSRLAAERRYASRSDPPESREGLASECGGVPLLHLLLSAPPRRGKTNFECHRAGATPPRSGGETQSRHIICQSDSLAGALGCPLKPEVTLRPLIVRRARVCDCVQELHGRSCEPLLERPSTRCGFPADGLNHKDNRVGGLRQIAQGLAG